MKREIETIMSQSDALVSTYIWLAIYGVAALAFFSIGAWIIIRGGKDVLEILTGADEKQ